MLLARTGSEQLIRARADERSYCDHRLGGVRRGTNWKAKFGSHDSVHLVLADYLQHGFRMHHPVQGRLHHHRHMADHGQHETRNQSHVVIKRQPAINAVATSVNFQYLSQGFELAQHGSVGQRHALLKSRRARRMLNERQAVGSITWIGQFLVSTFFRGIASADKRCAFARGDMAEHIFGKILIDDDHAGSEVRSYSGKSEAIFRRLNLEVGIGNDGGYRA